MFYQYKTQVLNLEDHWIQIHEKSVCRLEVQDYTQLSFCIVITVNNLIANWLDFLDILHWTAKGCNDFSGFNLIVLQYLHVFLCGKDMFSHFSFSNTDLTAKNFTMILHVFALEGITLSRNFLLQCLPTFPSEFTLQELPDINTPH
jgi:hypothetical protein